VFKAGVQEDNEEKNNFGFPYPIVGDYVVANLPTNRLTLNTVGRVLSVYPTNEVHPGGSVDIQTIAGNKLMSWRYGVYVLSEEQMREYLGTLAPERITAPWALALCEGKILSGLDTTKLEF
jgi:hypothetical protein